MKRQSAAFAYSLALYEQTSTPAIARRAYQFWEQEGRPHGSDLRHWLQAESEIAREFAEAIANAPGAPRLVGDNTFLEEPKRGQKALGDAQGTSR